MTAEECLKKQGIIMSLAVATVLEELERMVDRLDRLNERYARSNPDLAGRDTDLEIEVPKEVSQIGT